MLPISVQFFKMPANALRGCDNEGRQSSESMQNKKAEDWMEVK